ncbi:MAG: hypothetical protein OHK0022_07670 [Roseiflexaceae bacterium]
MALPTHITRTDAATMPDELRERSGRPRRNPAVPIPQQPVSSVSERSGSHMPLDTGIHWTWRNPLNVLPAGIIVLLLLALIALAMGY